MGDGPPPVRIALGGVPKAAQRQKQTDRYLGRAHEQAGLLQQLWGPLLSCMPPCSHVAPTHSRFMASVRASMSEAFCSIRCVWRGYPEPVSDHVPGPETSLPACLSAEVGVVPHMQAIFPLTHLLEHQVFPCAPPTTGICAQDPRSERATAASRTARHIITEQRESSRRR